MAPIKGGLHEAMAREYLAKHGIKQRIEGYVQKIVMDAPDDALMYLYKLVGQDIALRHRTDQFIKSGDGIQPEDINMDDYDEPSVVSASVHGLLMVQLPDGNEVQVPFSRMAASHHTTAVLLEKWCRELADALRMVVNPNFAAGKAAVKAVFREMDGDKDNFLTADEIAVFLQQKGVKLTEEQIMRGFSEIDLNHDGRVSLEEFEHHMGIRELPTQVVVHMTADEDQLAMEDEILEAEQQMHREAEALFNEIDVDRSGDLSLQEIWSDLEARGANLGYDAVKALFDELDTNKNGRVSLHEFKSHMGLPDRPLQESLQELESEAEDEFAAIDADMSGFIEFDELWADLEVKGFHLTRDQVMEIFQQLDLDQDGKISLSEFKAHMGLPDDFLREKEAIVEMQIQAEEVFDYIDKDHSGDIDIEELWQYLQANGADITREAAEEKFTILDTNHDGKVTLSEFLKYLDIPDFIGGPSMQDEQDMDNTIQAIVEAEEMFDQINTSGSGFLSFEEVWQDLLSRGGDIDETTARQIFQDLDINQDGKVSLVEFKARLGVALTEEELVEEESGMAERDFNQIDRGHHGFFGFEDLYADLMQKGVDISEEQAREVFDRMDKNHDGQVSLAEFKMELGIPLNENEVVKQMNEDAEAMFNQIDTDKSGYLDMNEIYEDLKKRGLDVTKEVVEEIFSTLDINKNGQVTLAEFKASLGLAGYDVSAYDNVAGQGQDLAVEGEPVPVGGPPDPEGAAGGGEEVLAQDGGEGADPQPAANE